MKRLKTILILLSVFVMGVFVAKADESTLYRSDKLTSNIVTCIIQDHYGYIWIGTQNGLNRFDGYRFTPYYYNKDNQQSLPHNNITSLFVDSKGKLWVGTLKGLAYYDEGNNRFVRKILRPKLDEPRITHIVQKQDGNLLIGTSGFKIFEIGESPSDRTIFQRRCYGYMGENDFYPATLIDDKGNLWYGNNEGYVFCFRTQTKGRKAKTLLADNLNLGLPVDILQLKNKNVMVIFLNGIAVYSPSMKRVSIQHVSYTQNKAIQTSKGDLLVGTEQGLMRYDELGHRLGYVDIYNSKIDVTSTQVSALFEDAQHNLWVGCGTRGLLFKANKSSSFSSWSFSDQFIKTGSSISSVSPARDGGVWTSVSNGNLYHFDSKGRVDRTIAMPSGLNCVYCDGKGKQWLGCGKSLYSFDELSGGFRKLHDFDCDFVQTMVDDHRGNLYVSTFGKGVVMFNPATGLQHHYSMFLKDDKKGFLCNDWVFSIYADSKGLVWIATSSGTSCYDPVKDTFRKYGWHNILEGYACLLVSEDAEGHILIGTDCGMFSFDKHTNKVTSMGLDLTINAIVPDPNGDVWCATSKGIWHYKRNSHQWIEHFNDGGLSEREYIRGVFCRLSDGRVVFGNSDGLVSFLPSQMVAGKQIPAAPLLTGLLLGEQPISMETLSGGNLITTLPVSESKSFSLSYIDNSFTVEFSNFDFGDSRNISLMYRLNDDAWSTIANGDNTITFRHLSPGFYRLYVKIVKNGVASKTQVYNITIRSPWYSSAMAYVVYMLLFLVVGGYLTYRYNRRRQEKLAEEKMQFLINATHDIRTPLTLILSPLHQLMRKKNNDEETTEKLGLIDHNARRILNLVNQILDIRKIDKQQMHLRCEQTELVPFVQNVCKSFETYAHDRNITFRFEHADAVSAWIDQIQMDKVVQNLLSNAFKFTPDGGGIEVRLSQQEDKVLLTVADTGVGLREEDIPKLFSRFYQVVGTQALGKEGTGIGLNLCKMIVEMHHGTIQAQNRQDGVHGSEFIVSIPVGDEYLKPSEKKEPIEEVVAVKEEQEVESTKKATMGMGRTHILLVDDDAEITDYIANELGDYYKFSIAHNGNEALKMLLADDGGTKYKLVVSDILMPEMDGFTLLRTIKSNLSIAHIPVILLTSEAAVGNRLAGLQRGADAFMAKPFLIEELKYQIDNLLARNALMKSRFSGKVDEQLEQVEQRDMADNDQQLMERIMESVNKNLSDSEFSVEQLAADTGLSRSHLHRKMKEIAGISPSEFIRNIRLEQAARLLKERKVNISQVAYTFGFNSPATFSKAFKQHFGQSPSEYIANED